MLGWLPFHPSSLPSFLFPFARNSGICIWAAATALLNVIIPIRLISFPTRSAIRTIQHRTNMFPLRSLSTSVAGLASLVQPTRQCYGTYLILACRIHGLKGGANPICLLCSHSLLIFCLSTPFSLSTSLFLPFCLFLHSAPLPVPILQPVDHRPTMRATATMCHRV